MDKWIHTATGADGNATLFGVNIFNYNWIHTARKVTIRDPQYNQEHIFDVYHVLINNDEHEFAAGEFSNCVWGFYIPSEAPKETAFIFHRKRNFIGSLIGLKIHVNGKYIGRLSNGRELCGTVLKNEAYIIEIDGTFGLTYCLKDTDKTAYEFELITIGGWKTAAVQSIVLTDSKSEQKILKQISASIIDENNLNDAERIISLCMNFYYSATDGIDEVLCSEDLNQLLNSLMIIGAIKCYHAIQKIITDVFENKDLPLDEYYYKDTKLRKKSEEANRLWDASVDKMELREDFRFAVINYYFAHVDELFS